MYTTALDLDKKDIIGLALRPYSFYLNHPSMAFFPLGH
jgi:hypothetical protein